jgi:heterodisulfide reductase subunit A-like polyferredoxin
VVVNLETSLEEQNAWVHITMTEKWHVQGELLPVSLENSKKFEEYDEMYTEIEKQALLQL